MPFANLLPDEKSCIRKMIRDRYDKAPGRYDDALVAADIAMEHITPGRIVPAAQVREIRQEMKLMLPNRPDPEPRQPQGLSPVDHESNRRQEANQRYLEKQNQKTTEKTMKKFTPEEKEKLNKFILERTGGSNHMTANDIADEINKRQIVSKPVLSTFVNQTRCALKKAGKISGESKRGRAKKANGGGEAKGAAPDAGGSSLSQVIEGFKAKRARLDQIIEQLEKCQQESVGI